MPKKSKQKLPTQLVVAIVIAFIFSVVALLLALSETVFTNQHNLYAPEELAEQTNLSETQENELIQEYNYTSTRLPTFEYLDGWHVLTEKNERSSTAYISPKPIFFCFACDAVPAPIFIHSTTRLDTLEGASVDEYLDDVSGRYHNITLDNHQLIQIDEYTWKETVEYFGYNETVRRESIYYIGEEDFVKIHVMYEEQYNEHHEEIESGWNFLLETVDFSSLK